MPAVRAGQSSARFLDITCNPRIPVLMETMAAITRATDPGEVVDNFIAAMRRAYGPRGYVLLTTRGLGPGRYRITSVLSHEGVQRVPGGPDRFDGQGLPVCSGGFLGRVIRTPQPQLAHHLSIRGDPVLGDELAGYGSMIAVPLFEGGKLLDWALLFEKDPEGFTIEDLEQLILRGNLLAATVSNVRAAQRLRQANAFIHAEVDQIAAIQRTLLPEAMPQVPGLSLAASYETFDRAGGDYYDVFPLRRGPDRLQSDLFGPWGILIADASGHGPSAAVVMTMLHAILHTYPQEPAGPGEVLAYVNRHLFVKRISASFVTAFFAVYDPLTRCLTYARAGHDPAVLKDSLRGGPLRRLDAVGSLPLGVAAEVEFEEAAVALESGQSVVLYTDGITEAVGPDGRMFGLEGIERALTQCTGEPTCVIDSVREALRRHEAGTRPNDDQTILAIQADKPREVR